MKSKSDRAMLHLAPGWALGWDDKQWMLLRARRARAETRWLPAGYIGSTKRVLLRCMREKGVDVTPATKDVLDHLPDTFREWNNKLDAQAPHRRARG